MDAISQTTFSTPFSLKFVPKGLINNIPTLVQIMAWRRPGDKALSETVMVSLLMHICVARSQWVNEKCPIYSFRNRYLPGVLICTWPGDHTILSHFLWLILDRYIRDFVYFVMMMCCLTPFKWLFSPKWNISVLDNYSVLLINSWKCMGYMNNTYIHIRFIIIWSWILCSTKYEPWVTHLPF